jgi:hypothetical protein
MQDPLSKHQRGGSASFEGGTMRSQIDPVSVSTHHVEAALCEEPRAFCRNCEAALRCLPRSTESDGWSMEHLDITAGEKYDGRVGPSCRLQMVRIARPPTNKYVGRVFSEFPPESVGIDGRVVERLGRLHSQLKAIRQLGPRQFAKFPRLYTVIEAIIHEASQRAWAHPTRAEEPQNCQPIVFL